MNEKKLSYFDLCEAGGYFRFFGIPEDQEAKFKEWRKGEFVTFEANVSGIVTKVTTGSADAGIVYLSDLVGADVEPIEIPTDDNLLARYPIAANGESRRVELARRWVDFTSSEEGLAILEARGFAAP